MNFDQSCQDHSDCAIVVEQACLECEPCGGGREAINKQDLDDFETDKEQVQCEDTSYTHCNNGCSGASEAVCVSSRCAVKAPSIPHPDDVSRTCQQDADCIAVRLDGSDYCNSCQCPTAAFNKADWQQQSSHSCEPDRSNCTEQCEAGDRAVCDQGTCVLSN